MKITKRQLRRIIKEEATKLLNEQSYFEQALEARGAVLDHMNGGSDHDEIYAMLDELYPELKNDHTAIINDAVDVFEIRGLR